MPELFLEILSEEIPARMQRRAAEDLKRLVTNGLVDAGLTYEGAYATATPRRLVLSVQGLPARSADRREERKGPRVGAPEKAVEGFLRSAGLASIDDAHVESDKKGEFYVARTLVPGRAALDIAGEVIEEAIRRFPWPVSMRWGPSSDDPGSLRWIRPLTSLVATFGAENEDPELVPVSLEGVPVGMTTVGHRFHAPERITVRRLDDYAPALEKAHVVVDLDRRRDMILHDARDRAFALGLELVEDEGLLEEVAGLVEWPVVLVGRFDSQALELPDEVIRLTIRENQKCFVTRDPATGRLANAFILTANLEAPDGGEAIIAGNERVIRARLADARFFWETDLRTPLEEHAKKLAGVTFHEKLGSQAERVERIAALAREIAPAVGADPDMAERAARLAKADLATGMVGEFPELQGYMGRRYAERQEIPESPEVAAAIEEHYRPLGPSDGVPPRDVSKSVALADKLDALVTLWSVGEKPSGSGDPFGLRRAGLGIVRIIVESEIRFNLSELIRIDYRQALQRSDFYGRACLRGPDGELRYPKDFHDSFSERYIDEVGVVEMEFDAFTPNEEDEIVILKLPAQPGELPNSVLFQKVGFSEEWLANQIDYNLPSTKVLIDEIVQFIQERIVIQQRDLGVPADVVRSAMTAADRLDLVDLVRRIHALQSFLAMEDGATLMAGYRRATNILKAEEKKDGTPATPDFDRAALVEPEELALADAVVVAQDLVGDAVAREDYAAAMTAIAALRRPVDDFFDKVLVNAPEPALRKNRLSLLAALRDVTRQVADFSAISG